MRNRQGRIRAALKLAAAAIAIAVILVFLHAVGNDPSYQIDWTHIVEWLEQTPGDDSLIAIARYVALAFIYYLIATTAIYVFAAATRMPKALRATEWIAVPGIRRLVQSALAVSVASSAALGSVANVASASSAMEHAATAHEAPTNSIETSGGAVTFTPSVNRVETTVGESSLEVFRPSMNTALVDSEFPDIIDVEVDLEPSLTLPNMEELEVIDLTDGMLEQDAESPIAPMVDSEPEDDTEPSLTLPETVTLAEISDEPHSVGDAAAIPQRHVISGSDSMWSVASMTLATYFGRTPTNDEIAPYWLLMIDENSDIASGNPNVLFDGEEIRLPAPTASGL